MLASMVYVLHFLAPAVPVLFPEVPNRSATVASRIPPQSEFLAKDNLVSGLFAESASCTEATPHSGGSSCSRFEVTAFRGTL